MNALLGEDRAIVSDIAGTTRDTIEEMLNLGGVMFRFIDTAGIRETDEIVEKIGIERTFKKMDEASIVLGMTDLSRGENSVLADAEYIWDKVNACGAGREFLLLVNKCDIDESESVMAGEGHVAGYAGTGFTETGSGASSADKTGKMARIEAALREKGISARLIPISAKTGYGLTVLTEALAEIGRRITGDTDETLVTNIRHYEALVRAATALGRVRDGLQVATLPPDLIAQDLREALYHLGEIVGEISTEEVLGNIFRNFCVGK